jgi:GT2 family glycosyltransferase/glycosyltransferase involved in cell wall biosynthesis
VAIIDSMNKDDSLPTLPTSCEALSDRHRVGTPALEDRRLAEIAALEDRHQEDLLELRAQMEEYRAEAREWRRQFQLNYSFLHALFRAPLWKALRPVRGLSRFFRSREFDATALLPWSDLDEDRDNAPGSWVATGSNAYFVVPWVLPVGWLRVEIKMASPMACQAVLYADGGHGPDDLECLQRFDVSGELDWRGFVLVSRPALGIRFDPCNVGGRFQVASLRVTALPPPHMFFYALRTKAAALRKHGLLSRSVWRGIRLLLRGRGQEFVRKVYAGLQLPSEARRLSASNEPANVDREFNERPHAFQSAGSRATGMKLNIVYVLRTAGLCGGVKVVLEHCAGLHARGHNVCVYHLEGNDDWFKPRIPCRRFESLPALKEALARFRGIKVATLWETAPWVADSLREGDRGYYLVQDIEESYCATPEAVAEALATYRLGLQPISEGVWTREQLRRRFGRDSVFVSIGLNHHLFQPQPVARDPQRILTQARTWSGGGLKGWDAARKAILRVHRRNPNMTLTTFSVEPTPEFPRELVHAHFRAPSDESLARLYSQAGLFLLTSTHEGFGLTAAEAMACRCPVVATRAQGNEEFCIDGYTALMASVNDAEGLAQCCLRLQSDPVLADELATNAHRFIAAYTWKRVIDRLEDEFFQRSGPEIIVERHPSVSARSPDHASKPRKSERLRKFQTPDCGTPPGPDGEYPDLRLPPDADVDASIVIPTIDNVDWVVRCIQSCRQHLPRDRCSEFVVVDDGTRDAGVLKALNQAADDLEFRLTLNHQNLGFSATVNQGMRCARGRLIVLCNNDIEFFQPWLEPLEAAFAAAPELGIIGAKLLYPDGTLQHAGMDKVRGHLRWHHRFAKWPGDHPQANQARDVWSVTGALYAVRREVLRRFGGFSTAYCTAYEDLDYCLRAWTYGVRVGYRPEVAAYHLEGGTRGARPGERVGKPLWWTERERAGAAYFEKKWAALRHVESFERLRVAAIRDVRTTARELAATQTNATGVN